MVDHAALAAARTTAHHAERDENPRRSDQPRAPDVHDQHEEGEVAGDVEHGTRPGSGPTRGRATRTRRRRGRGRACPAGRPARPAAGLGRGGVGGPRTTPSVTGAAAPARRRRGHGCRAAAATPRPAGRGRTPVRLQQHDGVRFGRCGVEVGDALQPGRGVARVTGPDRYAWVVVRDVGAPERQPVRQRGRVGSAAGRRRPVCRSRRRGDAGAVHRELGVVE